MRRFLAILLPLAAAAACGESLATSDDGDATADGGGEAAAPDDAGSGDDTGCGAACADAEAGPPAAQALTTTKMSFGDFPGIAKLSNGQLAVTPDVAAGPCLVKLSATDPKLLVVTIVNEGQCRYIAKSDANELYWVRVSGSTYTVGSTVDGFSQPSLDTPIVGVVHALSLVYFATGSPCKILHMPDGARSPTGITDKEFTGDTCHGLAVGTSVVATAIDTGAIGMVNHTPDRATVAGARSVTVDPTDVVYFLSDKPAIQQLAEVPALTSVGASARALAYFDPDLLWIEDDGLHAVNAHGGPVRLLAAMPNMLAFTADGKDVYFLAQGTVWRTTR